MDNTNGTGAVKKNRKEFRRMISTKLETCLGEFQNDVKAKKFKAAMKRAGKLLANDLYVKNKKGNNKREEKSNPVPAETMGA